MEKAFVQCHKFKKNPTKCPGFIDGVNIRKMDGYCPANECWVLVGDEDPDKKDMDDGKERKEGRSKDNGWVVVNVIENEKKHEDDWEIVR